MSSHQLRLFFASSLAFYMRGYFGYYAEWAFHFGVHNNNISRDKLMCTPDLTAQFHTLSTSKFPLTALHSWDFYVLRSSSTCSGPKPPSVLPIVLHKCATWWARLGRRNEGIWLRESNSCISCLQQLSQIEIVWNASNGDWCHGYFEFWKKTARFIIFWEKRLRKASSWMWETLVLRFPDDED